MKKVKYLFLILILTGCQNYQELNDIAITTAIAVDYSNKDNEYNIITQVVNTPKKDSSNNEPTFLNFSSTSNSLTEALSKIVLECPKKLYTSQTQLIILSKEATENKLNNILDFFIRNPNFRGETLVLLAPNKEDLEGITIQTLLDNLSSSNIVSSLKKGKEEGYTSIINLNDIADMYLNPYKEITIPTLYIEGIPNVGKEETNRTSTTYKQSVKIGPLSFFKDTSLLGFINTEEEKYLEIIKNNLNKTIITLPNNNITFELYNIKTKIVPNIKNNQIIINISGNARSYEIITDKNIENPNNVKKIQKELNKNIKSNTLNLFYNIRNNYNTDIFNFRDIFYKENPKYLNYNNWYQEIFPNLEIKVKSNIKLYEKGKIKETLKHDKENR